MTDQVKTVAVVIPAGEDGTAVQEVTVIPGTTAQDVLNALGKGTGFILGTISGKVFKPAELVFSSLTEDEKLVLTPTAGGTHSAEVGESFLWTTGPDRGALATDPRGEGNQARKIGSTQ